MSDNLSVPAMISAQGKKRSRVDEDNAPADEKKNKSLNKSKFIYGNYDRYYGYRFHTAADEDPRMQYFKAEWFAGKDCLDIGCNEGMITISVAERFGVKSMLGLDIDHGLIARARKNLARRAADTQSRPPDCQSSEPPPETPTPSAEPDSESLMARTTFRTANWVEYHAHEHSCDVVMCLSVSKWIHLNWGDAGLKKALGSMFRVLRPGGVLILEPQLWKSYKNNRNVSEVAKRHFQTVLLRPENFPELLLNEIGFRSVEEVSPAVATTVKGFDRPLFLYRK